MIKTNEAKLIKTRAGFSFLCSHFHNNVRFGNSTYFEPIKTHVSRCMSRVRQCQSGNMAFHFFKNYQITTIRICNLYRQPLVCILTIIIKSVIPRQLPVCLVLATPSSTGSRGRWLLVRALSQESALKSLQYRSWQ